MADEEKISDTTEDVKVPLPDNVVRILRWFLLGGAALITFAIVFARFMYTESRNNADAAPNIVIMGDSLFAHTLDETSVVSQLSQKLDAEIYDISFGGTCMSYIDKDARMDTTTDAFCMAALTQAIIATDFRYQENAKVRLNATEYFDERIEQLKSIDFSKVDILIIDHLLNDYQIAVKVDSGSNDYDEYTYEGALRSVLTQLKKKYPNLRIILVAPTKTWYTADCIVSTEMDIGGGTIDIYIESQKRLADELGVEWISLFELYDDAAANNPELLIGENGEQLAEWKAFTTDKIHPNKMARELIADFIYEYLTDGE